MDSVCGDQRLPTHEDRLSLPYLECVLKECLRLVPLLSPPPLQQLTFIRWNVPVPMGLPHRLMEDDVYRDWYLSSGTTVLVNIRWVRIVFCFLLLSSYQCAMFSSILHDCDAPLEFNPERYIKNPDLPDPRTVIFGFGRRSVGMKWTRNKANDLCLISRICPGRHFAEENLWSISTNLIATMDITKAIDENGDPITPPVEFTTGFVRWVIDRKRLNFFPLPASLLADVYGTRSIYLSVILNHSSVISSLDPINVGSSLNRLNWMIMCFLQVVISGLTNSLYLSCVSFSRFLFFSYP